MMRRNTKRALCRCCRADRVFFEKPRTRHSLNTQWICFTCRQPELAL